MNDIFFDHFNQSIDRQLRNKFGDDYPEEERQRLLYRAFEKFIKESPRPKNSTSKQGYRVSRAGNGTKPTISPVQLFNHAERLRSEKAVVPPPTTVNPSSLYEDYKNGLLSFQQPAIAPRPQAQPTQLATPFTTPRRLSNSGAPTRFAAKPRTIGFQPYSKDLMGRPKQSPKPVTSSQILPTTSLSPVLSTVAPFSKLSQNDALAFTNFDFDISSMLPIQSADTTLPLSRAADQTARTIANSAENLLLQQNRQIQLNLKSSIQDYESKAAVQRSLAVKPQSPKPVAPASIPIPSQARRTSRRAQRVYCDHCNQETEGFRGPHELERHVSREHFETKVVYYAHDISEDGSFLANCKKCQKKKLYNMDYNAAAHLRRAHFNKKLKTDSAAQKKYKSECNEPAMDECRKWMRRCVVRKSLIGEEKFLEGLEDAIVGDKNGEIVTADHELGSSSQETKVEFESDNEDTLDSQMTQDEDAEGEVESVPNNYTFTPENPQIDFQADQYDDIFGLIAASEPQQELFHEHSEFMGIDTSGLDPSFLSRTTSSVVPEYNDEQGLDDIFNFDASDSLAEAFNTSNQLANAAWFGLSYDENSNFDEFP